MSRLIDTIIIGVCSGECCRLITLSVTPEEVAVLAKGHEYRMARWAEHTAAGGTLESWTEPDVESSESAPYVVKNFIPVRRSYYDGVTGFRLGTVWPKRIGPVPEMQYRCSSWDGRTKKCTDYANRPWFCQSYGINKGCPRSDCTLRALRYTTDHLRWEGEGGPAYPMDTQ